MLASFVVPILTQMFVACSGPILPKGGTANTTWEKLQPLPLAILWANALASLRIEGEISFQHEFWLAK